MAPKSGPVEVHAVGDEAAAKTIASLGKRGADPRPAFRQITEELRGVEVPWFASHGRGSWAPLADRTREAKERENEPPDPLVKTGALLRSLTVKRGSQGVRTASKTRMRFGTKVYYARFHRDGTGVPVRNPLIPVDVKTRRRMVNDVRLYMLGKTKGKAT